MTSASGRSGPFWDAIEGRAPLPPSARLLGWELEHIDAEAGTISVRYAARPEFANPMGNVQGGFIAAMLDEAMGPALVATLRPDQFAPTLEMKVSYLEPVRVGALRANGRVVDRGSTIAFLAAELLDSAGTMLARASATARIITLA